MIKQPMIVECESPSIDAISSSQMAYFFSLFITISTKGDLYLNLKLFSKSCM